jgi:glycosyltransferase involved in cell wall biosynthesis
VDAYIALTRFQRDIFVRDGFPADLVHIKPNFSLSNVSTSQPTDRKDQIVYVGSLRKEKGVDLLLDAWERVHPQNFRLILLGDGPYRSELQARYGSINSVTWMGFQSMSEVSRVLGESKYIAICSRWYEGFAMVLLEAFNSGTPAIAPNHAAFPELMDAGRCGFLFEPSNVESLAEAIGHAVSISDTAWREHSAAALNNAAVYSSDASYVRLLEIYDTALEHYCRTQ